MIRVSPANFGPPANSHGPTGHGSLLCHTHGGRPVYSRPSCDLLRYHAISCETCHDFHMISGKRNFPVSELKLFASARSAGKDMKTPFGEYTAMHTAMHTVRAAAHNTTCTCHNPQCARGGVLHTPARPYVFDSQSAAPPRLRRRPQDRGVLA
jgi:hypothetical protein